jgi:hypothetical protein
VTNLLVSALLHGMALVFRVANRIGVAGRRLLMTNLVVLANAPSDILANLLPILIGVANGVGLIVANRLIFADLAAAVARLDGLANLLRITLLLFPALVLLVTGLDGIALLFSIGPALNGIAFGAIVREVMQVREFQGRLHHDVAIGIRSSAGNIKVHERVRVPLERGR